MASIALLTQDEGSQQDGMENQRYDFRHLSEVTVRAVSGFMV